MAKKKEVLEETTVETVETPEKEEQLALDDERRIKVLSPSMLVWKRFIRNKLAIVGSIFIIAMFVFAFIGGIVSPYGESEVFRKYTDLTKDYAGITQNTELRYSDLSATDFPSIAKAKFVMAINKGEENFKSDDGSSYTIETIGEKGEESYAIFREGTLVSIASKLIYDAVEKGYVPTLDFRYAAEKAKAAGEENFTADGETYKLAKVEDDDVIFDSKGNELIYISDFIVNPIGDSDFIPVEQKAALKEAIEKNEEKITYDGVDYKIKRENLQWLVKSGQEAYVIDTYSSPSKAHWLGTDGNGMDVLTRLMYGGRVSLLIGFIVVAIETIIGVILGGISGYFSGWVDNIIMRIVDIFNCIPTTPLIIILGAMMDAMRVDPTLRMIYLMITLGVLSWPGTARLVRGQILSLREQEFMTATEATGISVSRRIFKHLVPNVIPQLIVICTMGLGDVIITESTLSFLGLGVKFPFASWGNIINAVSNVYVMTNYLFVWIPAGFCILITVLGFNFIGDGLRDAFDPKMKR